MHIFIPKNLAFCQPSPVGEGGSRRLTDEVSIMLIALFRHAHIRFTPAHLFLAGVQTMCARICSAFSCDMFARVVCLRLRRAAKLPTCVLSFVALTRHAWLARLTRARGVSFQREGNALFDDFWYFSSLKSMIKEMLLMILIFQSSFRLSEKNEKDKKRKVFLF